MTAPAAVSPDRDPAAVAEGVRAWLASRGQPVEVVHCERPAAGLSSDTVVVRTRDARGQEDGLVVRLPPAGPGAFPDYDLGAQLAAQRVASANGVPVPHPAELVTDERWLGAPFVVMPFVPGHVPGSVPLVDPWIGGLSPSDRARLYDAFVDVLARVHTIPPARADLPGRTIRDELDRWRRYLDWCADGEVVSPRLWAVFDWCAGNRPEHEPPHALLWGDVRLGNVIFDDDCRVRAVLDWEMAMVGAPEHDVAWWRTLEATQDELFGRRVDGFPDPGESLRRYEGALGRAVEDLDWHEVFALVRSAAVMTRLAVLDERAGRAPMFPLADNPLVRLAEKRIEAMG